MLNKTKVKKLSPARWQYIKLLRPGAGNMVHRSVDAFMVSNPEGAHLPAIPVIRYPGKTYNVGRNKAKRERRAMFGARKWAAE